MSETIDRYTREFEFSDAIDNEHLKRHIQDDPYNRSGAKLYVHESLEGDVITEMEKEGYAIVKLPASQHGARYGCAACGNRQHFSADMNVEMSGRFDAGGLVVTDALDVITDMINAAGRFKAVEVLSFLGRISRQVGALPSDPNEKMLVEFSGRDDDGNFKKETKRLSLADIYDMVASGTDLPSPGGMDVRCSSCGASVWNPEWSADEHSFVNGEQEGEHDMHENCGGCFVCSDQQPLKSDVIDYCKNCMGARYAFYAMEWDPEFEYTKEDLKEMKANGEEPEPESFREYYNMMYNNSYCYDSQCGWVRHVEFWGIDQQDEDFIKGAEKQALEEIGMMEEHERKAQEENTKTIEEVVDG